MKSSLNRKKIDPVDAWIIKEEKRRAWIAKTNRQRAKQLKAKAKSMLKKQRDNHLAVLKKPTYEAPIDDSIDRLNHYLNKPD